MNEKYAVALNWESQARHELTLDIIEAPNKEEALGKAIIKRQKENFSLYLHLVVKINKDE